MLDIKQTRGIMEPIKKLIKQAATQIDRECEKFASTLVRYYWCSNVGARFYF